MRYSHPSASASFSVLPHMLFSSIPTPSCSPTYPRYVCKWASPRRAGERCFSFSANYASSTLNLNLKKPAPRLTVDLPQQNRVAGP